MNDELFFESVDYIETLKSPYCLLNNSLLSLYRDGKLFPEEDRESVFLLPAPMRFYTRNDKRMSLDIFGVTGLGNINLNKLICTLYMTQVGSKIVINPYVDKFHIVDVDTIFPFNVLNYKGRQLPIPHKTEKYLEYYYGKDWKTPRPPEKWDWINDSKTVITANSITEAMMIDQSKNP